MDNYKTSWNRYFSEHAEVKDPQKVILNYNKIAELYESDCTTLEYLLPEQVSNLLKKEMSSASFASEKFTLLDIASGTGLLGKCLRRNGFKGYIDGVDASQEMLSIAEGKHIYRNLSKVFLTPDAGLPFTDNQYDAVTCVGAFSGGHLTPDVLAEFVRVAKPGAMIVFTVRNNSTNESYFENLKSVAIDMESNGTWKKLKNCSLNQGSLDLASPNSNGDRAPMYAMAYCYEKL